MVDGVVAVVEAQVVQKRIGKVTRKVVPRVDVAAIMLQQIQRQDAVLCIKLREQGEPDPTAPVQQEKDSGSSEDENLLDSALSRNGAIATGLSSEIELVILVSGKNNVPEEQETVEEIPIVPDLGGAH